MLRCCAAPRMRERVRRLFSTGSNSKLVFTERDNGIVKIVLNAPDKLNPLTVDMGEQFKEVVNELKSNPEGIRCAILTGAGKAFSAGGDLQFLEDR